jgi:hypothetical protein
MRSIAIVGSRHGQNARQEGKSRTPSVPAIEMRYFNQ